MPRSEGGASWQVREAWLVGFLRKLVLGALAAVWAVFGAIPVWGQENIDPQFVIRSDDGDVIGVQTIEYSDTGLLITRELRFSIDGHQPVRSESKAAFRYEPSGHLHPDRLEGIAPQWLSTLRQGAFSVRLGDGRARIALVGRSIPFPTTQAPARELYITTQDDIPVIIWLLERDESGTIQRATLPGFGNSMHFSRASDEDIANAEFGSASVPHPMIPIPYDITRKTREGHMRWRTLLPEEVAAMLPQTGQQRIAWEDGVARFDICATCGPGLPDDPASLAAATTATPWLQSDAPIVQSAVRNVRPRIDSNAEAMAELMRIARRRLSGIDYEGHATAVEALRNRAGDCTEDAVVLAAFARAIGIPAYVANGMVYSRERFHGVRDALLPHSWVVAYVDGAWQSFDMTLEEGFGATHIALTLGDGSAKSVAASHMLAGLIEWDSMAEVRQRPTSD